MEGQSRTAVVTEDPTKGAAVGDSFQIWATHYVPVIPVGAGDLKEWDHFGTTLIGLFFSSGPTFRTDGSAVLIGPGIALAARHVLDPILPDLLSSNLGILAFSVIETGMVLWRVSQVVLAENDVAILRLDLASTLPQGGLHVATLTTRLPEIGEPVMIAGIRGEGESSIDGAHPIVVRIGVGEVTAVYPTGRDRVMLPHPCLEVKCLTVGGMSGGPAFDKDGNILGILTSSFEDEIGPSYISLWWPLAAAKIETCWPSGIVPLPTTLLDLRSGGCVGIVKPEALEFGVEGSLAYKPWS